MYHTTRHSHDTTSWAGLFSRRFAERLPGWPCLVAATRASPLVLFLGRRLADSMPVTSVRAANAECTARGGVGDPVSPDEPF